MTYVIDNLIVFDNEEKTLCRFDNPSKKIHLTTTSSRLMEVLVINSNRVLFRTYLLEYVWEKNGYVASEASLNNNISTLRKSLTKLANDSIEIITVPKTGFKLEADVTIFGMQENNNTGNNYNNDIIDELIPINKDEDIKDKSIFKNKKSNSTLIIFGLFILFYFLYFLFEKSSFSPEQFSQKNLSKIGELGQCSFFNVGKNEATPEEVVNRIPKIKRICDNNKYNVYYDFSDNKRARSGFFFVAACTHIKGNVKCENIKNYIY